MFGAEVVEAEVTRGRGGSGADVSVNQCPNKSQAAFDNGFKRQNAN